MASLFLILNNNPYFYASKKCFLNTIVVAMNGCYDVTNLFKMLTFNFYYLAFAVNSFIKQSNTRLLTFKHGVQPITITVQFDATLEKWIQGFRTK